MFKFLKEKLKKTISNISEKFKKEAEEVIKKKAEELAEEKEVSAEKIEEISEESTEEKKEVGEETPEEEEEPKEAIKEEPIEEKKEITEEAEPEKKLEEEEEIKEKFKEAKEEPEEEKKKGFFSKLFKRKKEEIEEIKEEIAEKVEEEKVEGVKITYFVHGTTTDNESGLATGQEQGELSELGKEEAKKLGDLVEKQKYEAIFCSDLKRAVDSANLGFKNKYRIIQDKRLREIDYGKLTRHPAKEFNSKMVNYMENPFPSGESYKDVEIRIAEFLNDIYDKYYEKHIAIVAHQAPQLAIEVLLNRKTWKQAIKEDWRLKKAWQPGWEYFLKEKVEVPEKPKAEEATELKEEPEEEKKGFFKAITEKVVNKKINGKQFEKLFWDLELVLLENNVAVEVIDKIKENLKQEIVEKPIKRSKIEDTIKSVLQESLVELFDVEKMDLLKKAKQKKPFVVCFVGINGSGKTTTIAKIAHMLKNNGLSCVLVAGDTWRQAAIEQLETWARKLNVPFVKHSYGSDPAAVAYDGVVMAKARNFDVVLIDTAGRMHSNTNLMDEMKKIVRVAKPDLKIFIGESITGNDCIEQAKNFDEAIGIDGIILSKADVDEKGGAAISVSYVIKKPILYLGTGQTLKDLIEFSPDIVLKGLGLEV